MISYEFHSKILRVYHFISNKLSIELSRKTQLHKKTNGLSKKIKPVNCSSYLLTILWNGYFRNAYKFFLYKDKQVHGSLKKSSLPIPPKKCCIFVVSHCTQDSLVQISWPSSGVRGTKAMRDCNYAVFVSDQLVVCRWDVVFETIRGKTRNDLSTTDERKGVCLLYILKENKVGAYNQLHSNYFLVHQGRKGSC